MMISRIELDEQIDEKKFFISLMVSSILESMTPDRDPKLVWTELQDIIQFEKELHRLEDSKNDRNH